MTEKTITIEDVGPIRRLEIPLREGGGFIVLGGENGAGKSHAIAAAQALVAGKAPTTLTKRDGSLVGHIEGLGVRLVVGAGRRASNAEGQLVVRAIDPDLDPSVLVDPGLKDPEAADARRLRVLVHLSGLRPTLDLFADLHPEVRRIASAVTVAASDVVDMAAQLKKDLEAEARKAKAESDREIAACAALRATGEGVDFTDEHDADVLRRATDEAQRALADAEGEARTVEQSLAARREAEAAVEQLRSAGVRTEAEDAEAVRVATEAEAAARALHVETFSAVTAAINAETEAKAALVRAQEALRAARAREQEAAGVTVRAESRTREARAQAARGAASREALVRAEDALARARASAGSGAAQDLAPLRDALRRARDAEGRGAVLRAALARLVQADEAEGRAQAANARHDGLRAAAAGCERVLASIVARVCPAGVRVVGGRLVVDYPGRGDVYLADLSAGERWTWALDAVTAAAGPGALLAVRQEAWEGLDPAHRAELDAKARERGVWVITAEATDGPLHVEQP